MRVFAQKNKFARMAAAVSCALLLSVAPVMPAFAAGEGTGSITVNIEGSGNSSVTYNAFKIFSADVDPMADGSDAYKATNISWASTEVQTAVDEVLSADATTNSRSYTTGDADAAATYLATYITGTNKTTRVDADSLANKLADKLDALTATATLTSGTKASDIAEGYYLIVSTSASLDEGEAGTSPIFTMLGENQDLTITEKVTVPTLTKAVKQDSTGSLSGYTDAQMGQEIEFTLTGTVADNVNTYGTYAYTFTDTLPVGMDPMLSGVKVSIDGKTVNANSYAFTTGSNMLQIAFANLKGAQDESGNAITISSSSVVTVTYAAKLNSSASMGVANANTATLTYSNNPNTDSTGTTKSAAANVYTFALQLNKVKQGAETTTLSGAEFTIQASTADDSASSGKYVQSSGSHASSSYTFTTDDNGVFSVSGLDAGEYTITETKAPSKYKVAPAIKLTIAPDYKNGSLNTVNVSLSGGNGDGTETTGTRAAYSNGTITLTVTDAEGDSLPITGLNGITAVYVVGGVLFVVSVAVIVRRRTTNA